MSFLALLARNPLALAGGIVLSLLAAATPLLSLQPPNVTDTADRFLPPMSGGHPLGTDHLGRELLSRLIWGTQLSLAVGVAAAVIAATLGASIGSVYGGRTDAVNISFLARKIRGVTVGIARKEFVDARLSGLSNARIIVSEL